MGRRAKIVTTWFAFVGLLVTTFVWAQEMADAPMMEGGATVHRFADLSVVDAAWSQLVRAHDGVAMELHTSELEPGAAYTAWWVVFNNPGACSADPAGDPGVPVCGEDDIFGADGAMAPNPLARISVLWADGTVVGDSGAHTFSAYLPEGRAPGEVLVGPGLEDADAAEVHVVVRTHGAADTARLHQQLTTFEPDPAMGGSCESCQDVQFAVHLPTR